MRRRSTRFGQDSVSTDITVYLNRGKTAHPARRRKQKAASRQQTADSRQQIADSRQQTADSRQKKVNRRQQTADSRQQIAEKEACSRRQTADRK
jgi:hypothetical protein